MSLSSDRPVRIGVVPILDGSGGGIYQYSLTMLDALPEIEPRPELVLFTDRRFRAQAEAWRTRGYGIASLWPRTVRWRIRNAPRRVLKLGPVAAAAAFLRAPIERHSAGAYPASRVTTPPAQREWIARYGVDFLLFPAPSTIVFQPGVPYVLAVHDLQHRLHPEFPELSAGEEWAQREDLFRNGIGHALTVLVDSEIGRDDVLDCYGELISADRVKVLPFLPASYLVGDADNARALSVRERLGLPERYLFFPAQLWPHKNHVRVVQALALIRAQHGVDVPVVMCGSASGRLRASVLEKVRRTAADEGVEDLIHFLGYVDDDLMAPLYAASRGVLLPTFFGPTNIPILEAWAFGVPVLTSDVRGIREQCGDAAILVDPNSPRAIADGIYSLWTDNRLRDEIVSAGARRLALYGRDEYLGRLSEIVQDATSRVREGASNPVVPIPPGPEAAGTDLLPTVSVIVPAYNRAETIEAAIESIRNQTFEALEIIVVDDGSSDETAEIARTIAEHEPRLRVHSHPQNLGAQAARNTGIRAARGEWIAFLDSDDVYFPESIEIRLDAAQRAGLEVVHSACNAIGPDGEMPFPIPAVEGDVYRALLTAPGPMFQGMIVKRELLHRIGLLRESVPAYQEWDTSIRLAAIAPFGFVERPTFLYDLRTRGAISRDSRRAADGYEYVVSRHWREVARVAGLRVLAGHYQIVADIRIGTGDKRGALRCAAVSQLVWPLSPRRTLRLLRRIARRRIDKGPAARPSDYHKPILTPAEGNALIHDALVAGGPYLVGRAGTVELDCITHYVGARRAEASKVGYPESVVSMMANNAGFFPVTNDTLDRFAEEYLGAVSQLDAICVWFNQGESDLAREFCPRADLVALRSLEPYYHEEPWSIELAGKRVLVVHPFADSIVENYEKRRRLLFEDPRILPEFELHVLKAVQSIAGEHVEHASWFDALDYMKLGMEAIDFDVCIVGAGAYGLPLAAHAKRLGKIAIHMGGATQILFGIRGGRWDDHEIIARLFNEHWTRPKPSEMPRHYEKVEGGAYW